MRKKLKSGIIGLEHQFFIDFFNQRYGVNKWKRMRLFGEKRNDSIAIISAQDTKDAMEAFKKANPKYQLNG